MKEKFKIVIKGNAYYEDECNISIENSIKLKGCDEILEIALAQNLVYMAVSNNMSQKDLLDLIKGLYKSEKEELLKEDEK